MFDLKITVTDVIGYTPTQVMTWKVTLVDGIIKDPTGSLPTFGG